MCIRDRAGIIPFLDRVFEAVTLPCELLAVYDRPDDTTVPYLAAAASREPRLRPLLNRYGRGPAAALRFGIDEALSDVVVVTMADGSDDAHQIDPLTRLVERGVVVASASRYMRGGQQVGGPWAKGTISRMAGLSLHLICLLYTSPRPRTERWSRRPGVSRSRPPAPPAPPAASPSAEGVSPVGERRRPPSRTSLLGAQPRAPVGALRELAWGAPQMEPADSACATQGTTSSSMASRPVVASKPRISRALSTEGTRRCTSCG